MAEVKLYEAVVTDGNPDPDLPGFIEVRIPELFGDNVIPNLVAPMYPGASFGGWQSVPQAENPINGNEVRVIVAHMGRLSFRWLGTADAFSAILTDPENRVGCRSKDGRHALFLDNLAGFFTAVQSDTVDEMSLISVSPSDDTIVIQTATGETIQLSPEQVAIVAPDVDAAVSHVLQMDVTNGVQVMHKDGVSYISLEDGDITKVNGFVVQISGSTIELGDGSVNPTHAYILSTTFFTDLITVMSEIVAIGAGIPAGSPVPTPGATAMSSKLTTSLSSGLPYLSSRIFGD